jgi:hypothetical protein
MEHLFSPCTRLHDLLEGQFLGASEGLQELNLNVSTDDLLSAERAFTHTDLYTMLQVQEDRNKIAWLTPHAAVARAGFKMLYYWERIPRWCCFRFSVDGKEIHAFARSPEHLLEICDVVLRLLAASVVHSVILCKPSPFSSRGGACIDAPTLAYLMEHSQSLKALTLKHFALDEDHIRVLGTYSRPDLKINLYRCQFTSSGMSALADVLERNQGPTELDSCQIDCSVVANGLRGNSRLKSFTQDFSSDIVTSAGNRGVLVIANAFRENKGLLKLDCRNGRTMSDEILALSVILSRHIRHSRS